MDKQELINYVVNSHARNELEINELLRLIHLLPDSPELNENQQIVLDYLKNIYSDVYEDCSPLETMYLFGSRRAWNEESELTEKEEFQVLAAFAEWGMEEVAE